MPWRARAGALLSSAAKGPANARVGRMAVRGGETSGGAAVPGGLGPGCGPFGRWTYSRGLRQRLAVENRARALRFSIRFGGHR